MHEFTEKDLPNLKITGLTEPSFRYKIKNPNQFEFLGYVNESELSALYASCWCFIYPSLNEGFGYPPLEAMRYGVPIIASSAASIPEVCGDAVLYINPKSIQDIKRNILKITEPQVYASLSQKSLKQSKIITEHQAKDTENLINWIFSRN